MKFDKSKKYVFNKEKFEKFTNQNQLTEVQKWADKQNFKNVEVRDEAYGFVKIKTGVEMIVFPEMCDEVI